MQEEGLTNESRHHLLLLHKQVQNKSDIEESLHAYINKARISAYEVGIFLRKNHNIIPLPLPSLRSHLSSSPMGIFSQHDQSSSLVYKSMLSDHVISLAGFTASDIFQSGLEDAGRQYACPGEVVNYTCTVVDTSDNPPIGFSVWRGTAFDCPGSSNRISLGHSIFRTSGTSGSCNNGAITAESVGVVDNCYTSRLVVTVSSALNGTTVECTLSGARVVGSRTIPIAGTGKLILFLLFGNTFYQDRII